VCGIAWELQGGGARVLQLGFDVCGTAWELQRDGGGGSMI